MKSTIEHPKVFISYAWGTEDYRLKVRSFATDLIENGIDVLLDQWSLKEGNDTYAFMEQSVTDPTITNVLILLDPIYEKKANERHGGVGTETQIISPEIYNKVKQEKFLPVIFERRENGENDSLYIRNQLDLAGRTLHVVKGSPSILRIQNLGNEIGDTIYIKEIDKYGSEQLISMVAHGDIDYAVCDESIARAAADSIPQIDINTAISFTQFYSWAVSKQSPALLDSLNTWLDKFQKEKEYQKIYKKYYDKE